MRSDDRPSSSPRKAHSAERRPSPPRSAQSRRVSRARMNDHEANISSKYRLFIKHSITPTRFLYRHYDPHGVLLYVGSSRFPLQRQNIHLRKATWRDKIFKIVIEPFETREEVLAAEQYAIRTEFPKYNILCCQTPQQIIRDKQQIPRKERLFNYGWLYVDENGKEIIAASRPAGKVAIRVTRTYLKNIGLRVLTTSISTEPPAIGTGWKPFSIIPKNGKWQWKLVLND